MIELIHDLHDPAVLAAAIAAAAGLFVAVRARGEHDELLGAVLALREDVGAIHARLDAIERRSASRRRRAPVDNVGDGLGTTD